MCVLCTYDIYIYISYMHIIDHNWLPFLQNGTPEKSYERDPTSPVQGLVDISASQGTRSMFRKTHLSKSGPCGRQPVKNSPENRHVDSKT